RAAPQGGWLGRPAFFRRGKGDEQARPGLAVIAVARGDRSAMSLDDCSGDCEAKPAVTAEGFAIGAFAVKPAENRLALCGLDAWAVIIDAELRLWSPPRRAHADAAGGGGEAGRIVDTVVDRAPEPVAAAPHGRGALARSGERDARLRGPSLLRACGARRQHRFDHQPDVDWFKKGARELCVDPARVAYIADQTVKPAHILVRDCEQLRALLVGLDPAKTLDRRTHRGDRVLQLMRHVGGKMLARVDTFAQRLRHVAERAGQRADLVAAARETRDDHFARAAETDPHRGAREAAQRADDRAGKKQR